MKVNVCTREMEKQPHFLINNAFIRFFQDLSKIYVITIPKMNKFKMGKKSNNSISDVHMFDIACFIYILSADNRPI